MPTIFRKTLYTVLALLLLAVTFLHPTKVNAQSYGERITSYNSIIYIQKDGSLNVTETIGVMANGNIIKHGIYRDFPTKYSTFGLDTTKAFHIVSIKRDGLPEDYHTEGKLNGIRIYIGNANVYVTPGPHVYEIEYTTSDQIGFFKDYDELYWNVTGNGWEFPINEASAEVHIPADININKVDFSGYLGPTGSKTPVTDFQKFRSEGETIVTARTGATLYSNEGMTISVTWPKGIINEPPLFERGIWAAFLGFKSIAGYLLLITVFILNLYIWTKVGKDENEQSIKPVQFEPPEGYTPAQVRILNNMGDYDDKCFSTAIMSLAAKGFISIKEAGGVYTIVKTGKDQKDLNDEELIIYDQMFGPRSIMKNLDIANKGVAALMSQIQEARDKSSGKMYDVFIVSNTNWKVLQGIKTQLMSFFRFFNKQRIVSNRKYLWLSFIPLGIYAAVIVGYNSSNGIGVSSGFGSSLIATLVLGFIGYGVFSGIHEIITKRNLSSIFFLIRGSLILVVYGAAVSTFLINALNLFGIVGIASIAGFAAIISFYFKALPRRTKEARAVQDRIDGFKEFIVSQDEYIKGVKMDIPEKFSMYEKYLPYAIALDVEPQWSQKFRDVFAQMEAQGMNTDPGWYSGTRSFHSSNVFASSFSGAFAGAIASSSVDPTSHSGHGGGGHSGGGGGGGGGGGW